MDVVGCHVGFLDAAGIRIMRSGFHTKQEHGEHPDEELRRFHVRLASVLFPRFRLHVRQRGSRFYRHAQLGRPEFLQGRPACRRVLDFRDGVLCHECHDCQRCHGRKNQVLYVSLETVFCATSATIVSGAMAERTKFSMYLIYSAVISLFIYPIEGHWTWGGGWLCNEASDSFMMSTFGDVFHDFAGSAIVHSVGGVLALVGAMALGPRIGKYGKDGKSRAIPGHNLTMAALGVFILWLGWFGFNPGSQLAASGEVNRIAISHVFLTTNLAAAAGGTATMVITWMKYGKPSLSLTLNGVLAGLVGITAGCDLVSPVGAVVIGLVCGAVLVYSIEFIDHRLHIDDPVGASSVHGVCGILGTLMTGLLSTTNGAIYGHGWGFFGAECFGILVIDLWAAACGFLLFFGIKKLHGLRVGSRVEEEGLDIYEHGEACYN